MVACIMLLLLTADRVQARCSFSQHFSTSLYLHVLQTSELKLRTHLPLLRSMHCVSAQAGHHGREALL